MPGVGAVVVAAGRGDRFGTPKQFVVLDGLRLVDRAVMACRAVAGEVVVVLPPGAPWDGPPVEAAVRGGQTRSESVRAGLAALSPAAEIVVVHDAARPLAGASLFEAVVDAVHAGADGAVPGVPVADTLKRVDGTLVTETVPRVGLVAAQTPQAFRADVLRRAHAGRADGTDDAALVEAAGGAVVVVPGDPANLKVTSAGDLDVASALLGRRRAGEAHR